jgi:quercetin dioxygenase-like cupin family protein
MKIVHPGVSFVDERGAITDILAHKNFQHATIIISDKGARRGNHYHKLTTQYIFMLHGLMYYWYDKGESVMVCPGDLVITPPNEIHALSMVTDNEFLVLCDGPRGGEDYESDTYRVPNIIGEQ